MRRRRSTVVCLGLTAVLATSLAGCGADEDQGGGGGDPEYTGICVDKSTGVRLDDSVCENDPLPDEKDFQAQAAVNAGSDPAVAQTSTADASASPPGASASASSPTRTGTSTPADTAAPTSPATTLPTTAGTTVPDHARLDGPEWYRRRRTVLRSHRRDRISRGDHHRDPARRGLPHGQRRPHGV
jgi:hypothetical protein